MGPASEQKTLLNVGFNEKLVSNATKTFVFSKKYIHIMVQSSIFNILCQRMTVNQKEILLRKYEGVPYFVVAKVKKINDSTINMFASWLKGIKDAINKNYLKTIHLFLQNSNNDIIETYSLGLKYNTDPNYHNPTKQTSNHVKDATKSLLEAIYGLSGQFKDATNIEIEFTYTCDTPVDYEPPGFEAAQQAKCLKISDSPILLGKISTGFHKLIARCSEDPSTPANSLVIAEHETIISEAEDDKADAEKLENSSAAIIDLTEPANDKQRPVIGAVTFDNDAEYTGKNTKKHNNFNNSNITVSEHDMSMMSASENNSVIDVGANDFSCICKIKLQSSRVKLINCAKCKKPYHGVCFGFMEHSQSVYFLCVECGTTDEHLKILNKDHQIMMAKIRLITYFVLTVKEIPDEILKSLTGEEETLLFKKMKHFGVIQISSRKDLKSCKFKQNEILRLMSLLFNNQEDSQYLI